MNNISDTLQKQRIRNRIIEVLEMTSSKSDLKKIGADSIVNMWEDWVDDEIIKEYREPVFTKQEQKALLAFHSRWKSVTDNTPKDMPPITELLLNKYWLQLMASAKTTLDVFSQRGRLKEDTEQNFT